MDHGKDRNPYETLRLSTKASIREVIERSKELSENTMDSAELAAYRRAVESIRQHPATRAHAQFWEPPDTRYENEEIEDFCERNRRPPVDLEALKRRKQRFIDEDCDPKHLVVLAMPPIQFPDPMPSLDLRDIPRQVLDLPLEPWELFF